MKELNPENDLKINQYKLDIEAATISSLLNTYDKIWNEALAKLEKLNSQIENINDELKNLRLTLSFRAKSEWKNIPEFNEGKPPSDKLCESWAVWQPEYQNKFGKLKQLRSDRAEAIATEALFRCYHYQLLNKSGKIDTLTKQWAAQYFSTDRGGNSPPREETQMKETNSTKQPNRTLKQKI